MSLRPSFPETFLEDLDNGSGGYDSHEDDRDPHDLSLSPQHGVRTSVVDNMLLSLDQFSDFNAAGFGNDSADDPDPYNLYSRWNASRYGRSRGNTFTSTVSSDVDGRVTSSQGRYSEQTARGRRSNSSSNLPTVYRAEAHSGRERTRARALVNDSQRASNRGDRPAHNHQTRQRRAVSQSSDSSVDVNQLLSETRVGKTRHHRRSASFDYGARPNKKDTFGGQGSARDQNQNYHDIDAAPTPTVRGGPRKELDNGFAYNRTPALSRKNSGKSSKSAHNTKKGRADTIGTATIRRHPDNNFEFFRDAIGDVPPIPGYEQPTAPSPTIPRHKSSIFTPLESSPPPSQPIASPVLVQPAQPAQLAQPAQPAAQPKERPGFFRRVFGSSKTATPAQPQRDSPRSRENEMPNTARSQNSATDRQKSSRENPHVVTKKPSFFSRRRMKSTPDEPPPPLKLAHSNLQSSDPSKGDHARVGQMKFGEGPEPSPVSSLRNIMKPYLADTSPGQLHGHSRDDSNHDHGDNDSTDVPLGDHGRPGPNQATGRKGQRTYYDAPSSQSTLDMKAAKHGRSDSFLADSSDTEAPGTAQPGQRHRRPMTSPDNPPEHLFESNKSTFRDSITPNTTLQVPPIPSIAASSSVIKGEPSNGASSGLLYNKNRGSLRPSSPNQTNWLEPASSTEQLDEPSKLVLPIEDTAKSPSESVSTASHYQTAASTPIIPVENGGADWTKPQAQPSSKPGDKTPSVVIEREASRQSGESVDTADKEQALKLYEAGGEEHNENEPTAAWLGGLDRAPIRKAYMDQFDWSDMNILVALRSLCSRLALKGETQQVDRVLDAFSTRWCECNANHGFRATGMWLSSPASFSHAKLTFISDVVHTICYSLLLLNTDLHLADIEHKMTRPQFIENTMPTIERVAIDAAPESFESTPNANKQQNLSVGGSGTTPTKPTTFAGSRRLSVLTDSLSNNQSIGIATDAGPLVNAPFAGTAKQWETQVESVLKEFYNSIQKQRLPLRGACAEPEVPSQTGNLLSITGHLLRRSPSTLSKAGSDVYPRGRPTDYRNTTGRFAAKQARSRPKLYPASTMASSRTSLDDQSSIFSPTGSSTTWSRLSLGKTLTSMSVDSFGSEFPRGDFHQSIGFANTLSHAIIREDSASLMSVPEDPERTAALLEDETLELAGAPWAKEGSLKHKQHLDSVDKRAKDRNWNESFAVIQRGWLRLFSFNSSSKSMRAKAKQRQKGAVVVGGGNWMENAEETWKFLLRQTIATALPPPGYSKSRPHVWALSLPTGAVHLFQCGTPEIIKEFVTTANYWSARLSKEPLSGGVSNVEYGWGDAVVNSALAHADEQKPPSASGTRPSLQSSIRSSIDQQGVRPRLPADRVHISDWTPPQQSMVAANLSETEQLQALLDYVKNVEEELQKHNDLRAPMTFAFTPRHPNSRKAMANWEKKSSYLLREIVKFRTYIECLRGAQKRKEEIYGPSSDAKTEDEGGNALADKPQNGESLTS